MLEFEKKRYAVPTKVSMYLSGVHDEGALLHVVPDPEEGEEPHPALDRLQPVHQRDLDKPMLII